MSNKTIDFFVGIAIFTIFISIVFCLFMTMFSSGKADYCYIESYIRPQSNDTFYNLSQHVPWGKNRLVSRDIKSLEEAKTQANLIGCEIK